MSIRFVVHLKPGAKKNAVLGWQPDPQARPSTGPGDANDDQRSNQVLVASVSAPPLEGKANAMLVAMLAKKLKLRRSAVQIVRGDTSRFKQIEVPADTDLSMLEN